MAVTHYNMTSMVKRLRPFEGGLNSRDGNKDESRATADWRTNSLQIQVPADKTDKMTIAAAFISREEFLHGKWVVAIMHTLGHLSLAADDVLEQCLGSEQGLNEDTAIEYLEILDACQQTQHTLFTPMEPFIEAVDKFQLLSVIEKEFVNAVRETYEAAEGQKATDDFDEQFFQIHQQEVEVATGQQSTSGDDIYVNPLYFHALSDIVTTDWEAQSNDVTTTTPSNTSQGRAIAEAVARATLDVPYPIDPLGKLAYSWFEPITAPGVELDSISPADLTSDDRYPMTEDEFDEYLGDYPKTGDENGEDEVVDTLVDDFDFEYTYKDAQQSWVARAFVNVRKALDDLQENEDINLGEIDPEELRHLLVERVHGVDTRAQTTMLDYATALLDIPRQVGTNVPEEDVMSAEGKPLPKVLMESFEHHGSFGAVVYNLTKDDTKYQLNWHTKNLPVDADQYTHVPENVDTYADLWHHYYFWQDIHQYEKETYSAYRDHLIKILKGEFDSLEALEDGLERIGDRLAGAITLDDFSRSTTTVTADNQYSGGTSDDGDDIFIGDEMFDRHDEVTNNSKIELRLQQTSTAVLAELADDRDLDPDIESATEDFECPLCKITSDGCGEDGQCAHATLTEQVNTEIPIIVDLLVSYRHGLAQRTL